MQRFLIPFASLVASAATAHAQPAPAPEPAGPPSQPADQPPNQPAQPPVEAAPPVQPPPPAPAEAKPEGPRKLSVGKESPGATFTPGLNLQGWFVYDESKKSATDDTKVSTSTFRVKRLEVSGSGDLIPGAVKYKFMFDLGRVIDTPPTTNAVNATGGAVTVPNATGPFSTLQDFFVTFTGDYADVSIGQFKNTVSWEAYQPATKIILPERSFIGAQIGGKRDVGLRLDKTFKKFMYSLNLFNGAGQNTTDNNNQKDVSFRLEVYPIPGMTIAGATYDSIGYRTRRGTKDRWEGDFVYETGPFKIQAEFVRLQDVLVADADPIKSQGGYVALAYKFPEMGSGAWKGVLQPVVRFGYWDPNADTNVNPAMATAANTNIVAGVNDERMDYEVGFNYYLRGHEMKIQASYDRQQYDNSSTKPANNEVIVATQLWF